MATHAHSTRTPLLGLSGSPQPLLGLGLCRQPGPVTIALAAMQAADPDRQRIRELRRRIADRIEADIALLDALDGNPDLEEENEHGGDIQDEPHDPQPDDVLPRMHGWDPRVADGARAARRQAEVMRARRDRSARP